MESSHNGTLPAPVPLAAPPHRSRWERWQHSAIAQQYLTPAGRAADFTVLKITPSMRPAFFDLLRLIVARTRFEAQLVRVVDDDDATRVITARQILTAWTAWQRYTVQLARALERCAQGHQATLPPLPAECAMLAAVLTELPLDDAPAPEATA